MADSAVQDWGILQTQGLGSRDQKLEWVQSPQVGDLLEVTGHGTVRKVTLEELIEQREAQKPKGAK